ncbi:hypothetical protein [Bradyrhizobium sp. 144]|uniref:hypothetical protein n=1 Tax=Bradyrhizobium sp. 144 TaxID=2782620 RepID=UPI001FF96FEE|nr:hypothetical protein [Bradyrhizobium sp. 144]MCK1698150.1 hypothetical protein [Bradyrhizobium sp. 144]
MSDSTNDVITAQWIRAIEENAFSNFACARRTYDRDQAKAILRNTTLLNFMKGDPHYTDHIVDDIFLPQDRYKELDLKRFIFLDYPLVVTELVTRPEYINAIRLVASGLLPLRFGRELNACVTLSPSGRPVIFFSERLFSLLSDYEHRRAALSPPGTPPSRSIAGKKHRREILAIEDEISKHWCRSTYFDFDLSAYCGDELRTNSARVFLLLLLLFIWGHELGHVFLKHLEKKSLVPSGEPLGEGALEFSTTQLQELDADMFGSDLYFAYVERGIASPRDDLTIELQRTAICQLFRFMTKAQIEKGIETDLSRSHPPAAYRNLYILLRHQKVLRQYPDMAYLIDYTQAKMDEGVLPQYDYAKKLISADMLL